MKTIAVTLSLFAASHLFAADLASYVDIFTGTSATGHTHPGACVPFGMIQAGPDTGTGTWAYCSGYQFADKSVLGYSLNHLSGTGCPDYGDVRLLPFTGTTRTMPMRSAIDKATERAEPGFYSVYQSDDGVLTEITALKHASMMRFTWKKEGARKVLVDLNAFLEQPWCNARSSKADVRVEDNDLVIGRFIKNAWLKNRTVGFAVRFGRQWKSCEKLPCKPGEAPQYVLEFDVPTGTPLLVEAALSTLCGEAAMGNVEADFPERDFQRTKARARATWNTTLSRMTMEGDAVAKTNFYTCVYHLFQQPNDWSDAGGKCNGPDNRFLDTFPFCSFYTTLSLWDTFRAANPLYTIVAPEVAKGTLDSFLIHYRRTGSLPVMSWGGRSTDCMIGNHAVPVIADVYLKTGGSIALPSYWEELFEAVKNTLTKPHPGKDKENWDIYDKYGYFPFDLIRGESVSRTLECSYDDWCAAKFAEALGHKEDAAFFLRRAQNWKNVFDSSIGFARGKDTKGKWRDPFDPYVFGHGDDTPNDFTEGNAFQYSWHVMQDVDGLIAAMGGKAKFEERLDALFTQKQQLPEELVAKGELLDISGMIGQYVHGNEPSHHVIYFYPLIGQPRKAAERIREVFDTFYMPGPEGLCGNDDCGQMSAWYLFSAAGFYPFNPCGGEYVLGAPQLPKVVFSVAGGKTFTVLAKGLSKENKYVKSVTLNGKPVTDWKIRHADVVSGGELVFEMTK